MIVPNIQCEHVYFCKNNYNIDFKVRESTHRTQSRKKKKRMTYTYMYVTSYWDKMCQDNIFGSINFRNKN